MSNTNAKRRSKIDAIPNTVIKIARHQAMRDNTPEAAILR